MLFLASDSFNDIEYSGCRKTLEAAGMSVFVTSDTTEFCVSSTLRKVKTDITLQNCKSSNFALFAIIGGEGIRRYTTSFRLKNLIQSFANQSTAIGAICLAPAILAHFGYLTGKKATVHPSVILELTNAGVSYINEDVVQCNNIVTASGPHAVYAWTSKLLETMNHL